MTTAPPRSSSSRKRATAATPRPAMKSIHTEVSTTTTGSLPDPQRLVVVIGADSATAEEFTQITALSRRHEFAQCEVDQLPLGFHGRMTKRLFHEFVIQNDVRTHRTPPACIIRCIMAARKNKPAFGLR